MEINTINAKRINVNSHGLHILCIPYDNNFYRFQIQHDKFKSVLTMYDGDMAQANDDRMLFEIAYCGFEALKTEYAEMVAAE